MPTNTDGGDLKGVEISYQQPFSFLPGFFSHFGLILNYTGVESGDRVPATATGAVAAKDDLTGLSKSAYERQRCTAGRTRKRQEGAGQASAAYRRVPDDGSGRNGNDGYGG